MDVCQLTPRGAFAAKKVALGAAGHEAPTLDVVRNAAREVLPAFAAPRRIEHPRRGRCEYIWHFRRVHAIQDRNSKLGGTLPT